VSIAGPFFETSFGHICDDGLPLHVTHAKPSQSSRPCRLANSRSGMAPEAQPLDLSPAYLVQRHFQDSADVQLDGVGKSNFPTEIRWGLGVDPTPRNPLFHT